MSHCCDVKMGIMIVRSRYTCVYKLAEKRKTHIYSIEVMTFEGLKADYTKFVNQFITQ